MRTQRVVITYSALVLVVLLAASGALAQERSEAEVLLQAARHAEQVDGDLERAIELYRGVVSQHPTERAVAARALVWLGQCYEKLGSAEAQRAYRQVLTDYADQAEIAAEARTRLAALERLARGEAQPGEPSGIVVRQLDWDNACGSPSPDGRYLSYCHWETGDVGLYDIVTGESRRLTTDGTWMEAGGALVDPWRLRHRHTASWSGRGVAPHVGQTRQLGRRDVPVRVVMGRPAHRWRKIRRTQRDVRDRVGLH
jgi:hypothetical protein